MPRMLPLSLGFRCFAKRAPGFCAALGAGLLACAPAAWAVSITNLNAAPRRFDVYFVPGQVDTIEIGPGQTWRDARPRLTIRLPDGESYDEVQARDDEEYVLWPDGTFGIQKRRYREGRR